jgi:uncharacterized protein (TIGR01777 family)
VRRLSQEGWTVKRLVRDEPDPAAGEILWDPQRERIDAAGLAGLSAVVHLAGESIAQGRWNAAKKRRILDSRERGTRILSTALASLDNPPQTFLCASAIGYYGDRGDEVLTEESASGQGFLAEVCRRWEAATGPAAEGGIRVVNMRFGVVLSRRGGALGQMLTPFKLGAGGVLGSGNQYISWIALGDLVDAILFLLDAGSVSGPVNLVAPHPVTNRQFTKALGTAIGRPTIVPMPAFAARLAFGEMADEMLLASTRVAPARLTDAGFKPRWETIDRALAHVLADGV